MKNANLVILSSLMLVSCAKKDFVSPPSAEAVSQISQDYSLDQFFPYKVSQDYFEQDQYDRNQTTINFQVVDANGASVGTLKKSDFEVFENSSTVSNFDVSSQTVNLGQKADIVFVIDITSSMQPTINSVKTRVRAFVEQMKKKQVQALLCLVTFKDRTEKKCDVIVEDNPNTPNNENLDQFLNDVSKLDVRGGGDTDENQLRALIDAAKSPWRPGAQRLAVLITDAGFHYQPDNKGAAKDDAPFYGDAMTAVQNSQLSLFAVAPQEDGYSRPFQGNPSLVNLSKGAYFDYDQVVDGKIGMDQVFNTIVDRVSTDYSVRYVVEDNSGLNSGLPMSQRQIQLRVKGRPDYKVIVKGQSSNLPNGHPEYKKRYKLSRKPREGQNRNLNVRVDGQKYSGGYRIEKNELVFDQAPQAGAKVEVSYDPASLREGMTVKSLILPEKLKLETLKVFFNTVEVGIDQLKMSRDIDGNLVLDPEFSVFSSEDPFRIVERGGLVISVTGVVK